MDYLHRHGVKGYITLNTLVFSGELEELERAARTAIAAGVNAALVQDLGAAAPAGRIVPRLAAARLDANVACQRRSDPGGRVRWGSRGSCWPGSCRWPKSGGFAEQTPLGIEVFVHGALCIAYSGQCMASFALGGRSANRGRCAQPCRLPYELIRDGRPVDLGRRRFLLSPRDLAAYDLLPELVAAGVDALKIEGRLKSAEYVAAATRHYRTAHRRGDCRPARPIRAGADRRVGSRLFPRLLARLAGRLRSAGAGSRRRLGQPRRLGWPRPRGRASARRRRTGRAAGARRRRVFQGDGRAINRRRAAASGRSFAAAARLDEPASEGVVEMTFGRQDIDLGKVLPGQECGRRTIRS